MMNQANRVEKKRMMKIRYDWWIGYLLRLQEDDGSVEQLVGGSVVDEGLVVDCGCSGHAVEVCLLGIAEEKNM